MTGALRRLAVLAGALALAGPSGAEGIVGNLSGAQTLQIAITQSTGAGGRFVTGDEPALLTSVTVRVLEQSNASGALLAAIHEDTGGGLPQTASIATLDVPPVPVPDVFQNITLDYSGPALLLAPQTTYWVVLTASGNGRSWRGSNSDPSVGDMGPLSYATVNINGWSLASGSHRPMFEVEGVLPPDVVISTDVSVDLAGQTAHDEDAVALDPTGAVLGPAFSGLPPETDLQAYHFFQNSGDRLYALDVSVALPALFTAEPRDVVRRVGIADALEFDGSAHGVPDGVRIDAASVHGSGDLLLSFDTSVDLDGVPGGGVADDEDLVRFDGVSLSLFFDGSAEGIDEALDLDGAHYDPADGSLLLSFDVSGTVAGQHFDDEDVLLWDPSGPTWSLVYDASALHAELSAADVTALPEPAGWLPLAAGVAALALFDRARRRH